MGRWWSRPWAAVGVLLLLCVAVYGVGLGGIPVIDRDEARFAQASRQMLESGDWVIPRVQDRPRLNKPPLIYWAQAASVWALTGGDARRDAIWMYRLPSVLSAIGTVLLTWGLARRMSGASVAFLAASMLAVSPLVAFDAHQARADQLLLLGTTWTMACLWACWRAAHAGRPVPLGWATAFWLGIAAGVMTKGPITPLVAGLAIAALSFFGRSWRWTLGLRPLLGLMIVTGAVGPWVYAVAGQVGFANYLRLIWQESAGRAAGSSEGHFGPPGMHLILLVVLFWPGSLATAKGVVEALRDGWPRRAQGVTALPWWRRVWNALIDRRIGKPIDAFLLAWALPSWVFFELFGAKLAHYPMPLYPAVAILSARAVVSFAARGVRPGLVDVLVWRVVGSALAVATIVLALITAMGAARPSPWITAGAVLAGLAAIVLVELRPRGTGYEQLLRRGRWAMMLVLVADFLVARPYIPGDETARIMRAVRSIPGWEVRPLASAHRQDSIVFETRGRVERLDEPEVAAWLEQHPSGLAIVSDRAARPPSWRVVRSLLGSEAAPWSSGGRGWVVVELAR